MKRLSSCSGRGEKDVAPFSAPPPEVGKLQQQKERFKSDLLDDGTEEAEEEDLCSFGQSSAGEKKRRLSAEQVKALEKNFEVENKLDQERKVRLALEVGLQPRQVAIWFQNRRARWKTKQLERDYGVLRARHDALKVDLDVLRRDKEALEANVRELKAEVARSAMNSSSESTDNIKEAAGGGEEKGGTSTMRRADGASDSDSSAVFNDEASPYPGGAGGAALVDQQQHCFMGFRSASSSLMLESKREQDEMIDCSGFFSDEQEAPSLSSWYCSHQLGWD